VRFHFALAAAAVMAVAATPAAAQSGAEDLPPDFTPDTVTPDDPFGDIDVSGAGQTVGEIYTFAAGLSGAELIEVLRRCQVIHPLTVSAQMLVDVDTVEGADDENVDDAGDVAGDDEPPPMPAGDLAVAGDVYYDAEHLTLCENLQGIVLGVDITDPMDMEADDAR